MRFGLGRRLGVNGGVALFLVACSKPGPSGVPQASVDPIRNSVVPVLDVIASAPKRDAPVRVVSIDMGHAHACALWSSGVVTCWGGSTRRQLGREDRALRARPELVPGLDEVVEIALADHVSCARRGDGSVWCWGSDFAGGLGDGDDKQPQSCSGFGCRAAPGPTSGVERAIDLEVGQLLRCVVIAGGERRCWGSDGLGLLGLGRRTTLHVATPVPDSLPRPQPWAVNSSNICGVRPNGSAWCLGDDSFGMLGDGSRSHASCEDRKRCSATPVTVEGLTDVATVTFGDHFACALENNGRVACWGEGDAGQLGDGRESHGVCRVGDAKLDCSRSPVMVEGLEDVAEVACGTWHCCARTGAGAVHCWGKNSAGQLGVEAVADRCTSSTGDVTACSRAPVQVPGLPKVVDLATSAYSTCALGEDSEVWCWGNDSSGELGDLGEARCREPDSVFSACSNEPLRVELNVAVPHS